MKLTELLEKNRELESSLKEKEPYTIALLSNITISQIEPYIEFELRNLGVNAKAISANYDTILQDAEIYKDKSCLIIFWELTNIIDGFQHRIELLSNSESEALILRVKSWIDHLFDTLRSSKLVIMNQFSAMLFTAHIPARTKAEEIGTLLNSYIRERKPDNFSLVDLDKIISQISVNESFNTRDYYSSKILYSSRFYKEYAEHIRPILKASLGLAKKALILDCDNTIWGGIAGEDGISGIKISGEDSTGRIFKEVQNFILKLKNSGVLLCLCSKNNSSDVEEIFSKLEMPLTYDDFVIKKINWDDKAKNISQIADELNIGLDSIVFVDDSEFEINRVKSVLEDVTVALVPKDLSKYPQFMTKLSCDFFSTNGTEEDLLRSKFYLEEAKRKDLKSSFESIESFLRSLELRIRFYKNKPDILPRMAQLTQKTNQFNLTTRRYTEAELTTMLYSSEWLMYAFESGDRLGSSGITGLSLIKIDSNIAQIDTFLMSCRVIGRNFEFAFFDSVIEDISKLGISNLLAEYIPTKKNSQVENFYDNLGFSNNGSKSQSTLYQISLKEYKPRHLDYIMVEYE
ncbi:MAG TPA: HAD-IIIC family phosphatase [Oligoflexia bacterium]|nr:HAD-IIIC family phosphatase [Oligoflexia bacterium]HMP48510.1 HAD-IIIC family phosphatase [Oligoflexia bacterium]